MASRASVAPLALSFLVKDSLLLIVTTCMCMLYRDCNSDVRGLQSLWADLAGLRDDRFFEVRAEQLRRTRHRRGRVLGELGLGLGLGLVLGLGLGLG